MKLKLFFISVVLLFASVVQGQVSSSTARRVRAGITLPATCRATNPVDVFIDSNATITDRWYICTSTNTWTAQTGPATAPGGSDTHVQFNDSSAFGGDAGLVYNKTTDHLSVGASMQLGANPAAAGIIRLPNNTNISFRNAANNADLIGLSINSSNTITVGNNGTVLGLAGGLWQINNATGLLSAIGAYPLTTTGAASFTSYLTATNCSDSAGAAACGSATAGAFVMDAAATTVVVSTTSVTANSEIKIQESPFLNTRLSVTCNTTTGRLFTVTALTAATSFTVTASAAPVTNPACLTYTIVN